MMIMCRNIAVLASPFAASLSIGLLSCIAFDASATNRPMLGVIRWDGYNGSPAWTQNQEFGFFKPEQYHWRAPWFVRRTGDTNTPLSFNPSYDKAIIQQITDQETLYAAAGIDYWAFCYYAKYKGGLQLRDNLEAYLKSPQKSRVKFALINICEHVGQGVPGVTNQSPAVAWQDWETLTGEYVELMKDPAHVKVLGNRPLFFLFVPSDLATTLGDPTGKIDQLKLAIQYFRDQATSAGLANPYMVGMDAGAINAPLYMDQAGLDAVSAYRGCFGSSAPPGPKFSTLWPAIRSDFLEKTNVGKGRKVIVPLASGGDQSPRQPGSATYQEPQPGDLAALVKNAFDYIDANPEQCEARAALIYAWNEHSEGGFLCPLMGTAPDYVPNTAYLDDLANGIREWGTGHTPCR